MTLKIQNRFFRGSGGLARRIESGIGKLKDLARIEKAEVTLERRHAMSPPFQARLHVAVPGPDVHVSAQGFTPESALAKALEKITRTLRGRKAKTVDKSRGVHVVFPRNNRHQAAVVSG